MCPCSMLRRHGRPEDWVRSSHPASAPPDGGNRADWPGRGSEIDLTSGSSNACGLCLRNGLALTPEWDPAPTVSLYRIFSHKTAEIHFRCDLGSWQSTF